MVDVWEYFARRDRELAAQSVGWDDDVGSPYAEEAGSGALRGRIFGRVIFSDRAFLQVNETIEIEGGCARRCEYAYFLIYDGAELWGEERDPTHSPAVHRHDRQHQRFPSSVLSFPDALTKAWATVAAEESLAGGKTST